MKGYKDVLLMGRVDNIPLIISATSTTARPALCLRGYKPQVNDGNRRAYDTLSPGTLGPLGCQLEGNRYPLAGRITERARYYADRVIVRTGPQESPHRLARPTHRNLEPL